MSTYFDRRIPVFRNWKRWLVVWGVLFGGALVLFLLTWTAFFEYVPPGKHLLIIAKDGDLPPPGQILAEEGEKGVQREVKGEGWHFVMPIVYTTDLGENTEIPPGKVGIVNALGGKPLAPGKFLAEQGEQGIQREVLPPGVYRINRYGFKVTTVDATEIQPGFVGVLRRKLGNEGKGRFATDPSEKGIIRQVLQPGLYYLNTEEFEVVKAEVGIFQTSFRYDPNPKDSTAITFTSKGGFPISMDCTIEWEVLPEDMPSLVAEYGSRDAVERTVIDVQAHAIGRNKGIDYGAQDFLEGNKREKFQQDFTDELTRVCKEKNVTIHSAFIRNIVIPETYLKPIRDKQIAAETELTNLAKQATAETEADVEREQSLIQQKIADVEFETTRQVAAIQRKVENLKTSNKFEIENMKAEYEAKIAAIDSQRIRLSGQAENQVKQLKALAKNAIYPLMREAFQDDGEAFLRYSLAKEQLNPKLILRVFHSGAGTFWTNMEGKGMNLLLPAPTGPDARPAAPTPPPATK